MTPASESRTINQGTRIFSTHTITARDLDAWVRGVALASGQQMAWNNDGNIYVLGDVHKAVVAMLAARDQHDEAFRRVCPPSLRPGTIRWKLDHLWAPVRLLVDAFQVLEAGRGFGPPSGFGLPPNESQLDPLEGSSTVLSLDSADDE